jgi:hypothetical protein
MTIPSDALKTFLDAGTDDPKQARGQLRDLVDSYNTLLAHARAAPFFASSYTVGEGVEISAAALRAKIRSVWGIGRDSNGLWLDINGMGTLSGNADPDADFVPIYDASGSIVKKVTPNALIAAATSGALIQSVGNQTGALATGATVLPYDDTIPENDEGVEFLSQAITPESASNILEILVNLTCAASLASDICAALFQDSTVNALAATAHRTNTSDDSTHITLTHRMVANTTSETTFKVRAGLAIAGTMTLNGAAEARKFGGVAVSSILIREVAP